MNDEPIKDVIQEECGVTNISFQNASVLIKKYGIPTKVELVHDANGQLVKANFKDYGEHVFNGFSWGYGGEGPHGLMNFLRECKFDVHINDIISLNSTNPQKKIWTIHTIDEYLS